MHFKWIERGLVPFLTEGRERNFVTLHECQWLQKRRTPIKLAFLSVWMNPFGHEIHSLQNHGGVSSDSKMFTYCQKHIVFFMRTPLRKLELLHQQLPFARVN
jgi:hypothetical protein